VSEVANKPILGGHHAFPTLQDVRFNKDQTMALEDFFGNLLTVPCRFGCVIECHHLNRIRSALKTIRVNRSDSDGGAYHEPV
jgi:hypothetical protein